MSAAGIGKQSSVRLPAGFRSLATLLTTWYAFASFTLVLVATVTLYVAIVDRTRAGETELVLDRLHMLEEVRRTREAPHADLKREVEEEWSGGEDARVYVRILSSRRVGKLCEGGNRGIKSATQSFRGCWHERARLEHASTGARPVLVIGGRDCVGACLFGCVRHAARHSGFPA